MTEAIHETIQTNTKYFCLAWFDFVDRNHRRKERLAY